MKKCALWLSQDCNISCNNHHVQGGYCGRAKSQNDNISICQDYKERDESHDRDSMNLLPFSFY